ncbi:hypothetical protein CBR_g38237 [Chara braunii]|uniref:Protein kinase domain-containing protein n=1 Tax=Chara braunii TaxID=69332 RepID=A0A388LPJ3_CHABU|nr:hypothetical protein CBR_g38237 [Chara braunii]|eukprot:GBG84266.1 hypothetical protein CBR_g38237 [Chara braunii]
MAVIRCARDCKVDCNLVAAIVAVLCLLSVTVFSSLNAKACPNRDAYLAQRKNCSLIGVGDGSAKALEMCLEDWCLAESNWTSTPDRCRNFNLSRPGFDPVYNKARLTDGFPDDRLGVGMGFTGLSLLILAGLFQAMSQIANCIEPRAGRWERRREADGKQLQMVVSDRITNTANKKKKSKKGRIASICMALSAWLSWSASTVVILVLSIQTGRDWGMYNCVCPLWIAAAVLSPVAAILFAVVDMKSSSLLDGRESSSKVLAPRWHFESKPDSDLEGGKAGEQNPSLPPNQWSAFRGSKQPDDEDYARSGERGGGVSLSAGGGGNQWQQSAQQSAYHRGGGGGGSGRLSPSSRGSGGGGGGGSAGQRSPYRGTSAGPNSHRTSNFRPGTPAQASPTISWAAPVRSEEEGGNAGSTADGGGSGGGGGGVDAPTGGGEQFLARSPMRSPNRLKMGLGRGNDIPQPWSPNAPPPPPPPPPRSPLRSASAATPGHIPPSPGASTGAISGGLASTGSIGSGTSDLSVRSASSDFSVQDLRKATNDFSPSRILGRGGFGSVYKGVLEDGTPVAVKRLHRDSSSSSAIAGLQNKGGSQGAREFKAEVSIISRVHHRHLVQLIGYAITENEQLLVYEYMPNGSLYDLLHDRQKHRRVVDWPTRVKIAVGAAKGLAYLHEGCNPKVVHRDVKAHNILLDKEFQAKVSDFGLARLLGDEVTHITTRVMGTFGYLAPEYALSGQLTERSDVYSFGVVLLELVTGRRPVDQAKGGEKRSLVEWAWQMGDADPAEFADPNLDGEFDREELRRIWMTGVLAVNHLAQDRPSMDQVMRMVKGEVEPATGGGGGGGSSSLRQKSTMRWFSGWISSSPTSESKGGEEGRGEVVSPSSPSPKNGSLSRRGESRSSREAGDGGGGGGLRKRGAGGTGGGSEPPGRGEGGEDRKGAAADARSPGVVTAAAQPVSGEPPSAENPRSSGRRNIVSERTWLPWSRGKNGGDERTGALGNAGEAAGNTADHTGGKGRSFGRRGGSQRRVERSTGRGEDEGGEEEEGEEEEEEEEEEEAAYDYECQEDDRRRVARVVSRASETDWGSFSGPASYTSRPSVPLEDEVRDTRPAKASPSPKQEAARGAERQRAKMPPSPQNRSPIRSPSSMGAQVNADASRVRRSTETTPERTPPREGTVPARESPSLPRRPTGPSASPNVRGLMGDFGPAIHEERPYRGR